MTTKLTDQEALEKLENLDPQDPAVKVRDRSAVAEIETAAGARRAVEDRVTSAVRSARSAGVTWTEIGAALGVSHQAAIKRYASSVDQLSLISLAEAADILGVTRKAVLQLVHDGLLVAVKAGRSEAVARADVQRLATRKEQVL